MSRTRRSRPGQTPERRIHEHMGCLRGVRRARHRCPARIALTWVLLASAGGHKSRSWAQATCGATPIRVDDLSSASVLAAAVNCTNGGLVEAVWAGTVALDAPIVIGAGTFLSVMGEDDLAEVHVSSEAQMFVVSPSSSLNLTNLKLWGGTGEEGGAIHVEMAALKLDTCVFSNNTAATGDGGAVWADGSDLTIVGGEFVGNSASLRGGAVMATDTRLLIEGGTRFEDNQAINGGAVFCGGVGEAAATTAGVNTSCSVKEAIFVSNHVFSRGGAAAFLSTGANVTESIFRGNSAELGGGALFGMNETSITINGCIFEDNETPEDGGAISASSATLGGNTQLTNNSASMNGGAVYGWDTTGTIGFHNVNCSDNTADEDGGCFYTTGGAVLGNATVMRANEAGRGGCIFGLGGSTIVINGGEFIGCHSIGNGGFLYASDGAVVTITGGLIEENVADKRGAGVYCSGDSFDLGGSVVTIAGGTFINNHALELGGALNAWGAPTVVTVTGGVFCNNTAKFYGGFVFLEEGASMACEGATVQNNYANDQGGGIYARDATWVNSSCDLVGNESPQGAAIYLTSVHGATFENHAVADNVASGGSVVYVADSSVIARGVTFGSAVGPQEDSSNRAIQLEGESSLVAEGCTFDGWLGDTVIHNSNSEDGSLVLDSCDFSGSSAVMVVISPHSDAEIRNAVVGDSTLENVVIGNDSLVLVDRALDCGDPGACGPGECVESALGVLCECLAGGACLDDGGALSLDLQTTLGEVTYSPSPVSFELLVSAAEDGTTYVIWELELESDDLALEAVPYSGVLPPGGSATVTVTGNPLLADVGGNLTSRLTALSVGNNGADSTAGVELEVESTFYLCRAFQYAIPLESQDASVQCDQCENIEGEEGVDCEQPGATLASLPIREGYWRSSLESVTIRPCFHSEACAGGTKVSSSDDYCRDGYEGPYCAVCAEGYGRGIGNTCHSCDNTKARLLITVGSIFILVLFLLLIIATVFLVGGLDAVEVIRRSVSRTFSAGSFTAKIVCPATLVRRPGSEVSTGAAGADYVGGKSSPALDLENQTGRHRGDTVEGGPPLVNTPEQMVHEEMLTPASDTVAGVEVGVGLMYAASRDSSTYMDTYTTGGAPLPVIAGADGAIAGRKGEVGACANAKSRCCGLGDKIKRWMARLPLDKLKILVVVWQILTVFPSITGVEFPPVYSQFLSWVDVVNLDIGSVFSAACVLPSVNFYHRLLATTLAPLGLFVLLAVTYHMAKRRAGIGSAGVIARRAAWSRHMAAGLLLTFLVFTSASTTVFKTFACDDEAGDGKNYLRADYRLSCESDTHMIFRVYAGIMILVYPVGIPLLYAVILWMNRESLNPRIQPRIEPGSEVPEEEIEKVDVERRHGDRMVDIGTASRGHNNTVVSLEELEELEERVRKRRENPDLVPSMFLWKDFGPDMYYYEVVECGRRILLTGVLIFIAPHNPAQTAMACIFAFASLLGFELLRPHLDPADCWLYRLGCVVIFLSNFLALLIKVDAAGEGRRSVLGGLLVTMNVLLIIAVIVTSWIATQQSVDDSRDGENDITLAKAMLTAEKYASNSARLTRETQARMTSAPSPTYPGLPQSGVATVGPVPMSSRGRQGRGVKMVGTGGRAMPSKARGRKVSTAAVEELWLEDKAQGRADSI